VLTTSLQYAHRSGCTTVVVKGFVLDFLPFQVLTELKEATFRRVKGLLGYEVLWSFAWRVTHLFKDPCAGEASSGLL